MKNLKFCILVLCIIIFSSALFSNTSPTWEISLTWDKKPILAGQTVSFVASIKNNSRDKFSAKVTSKIDGTIIKTFDIPFFQRMSEQRLNFSWKATSGDHVVRIKISYHRPTDPRIKRPPAVRTRHYSRNFDFTVINPKITRKLPKPNTNVLKIKQPLGTFVIPKADYAFINPYISWAEDNCLVNYKKSTLPYNSELILHDDCRINVKFPLTNYGEKPLINTWVTEYENGAKRLSVIRPPLNKGQIVEYGIQAYKTKPGIEIVKYVADPDQKIPDSNRTNNEWTLKIIYVD